MLKKNHQSRQPPPGGLGVPVVVGLPFAFSRVVEHEEEVDDLLEQEPGLGRKNDRTR